MDEQLDRIMEKIYHTCRQTAARYGDEKSLGQMLLVRKKLRRTMAAERFSLKMKLSLEILSAFCLFA